MKAAEAMTHRNKTTLGFEISILVLEHVKCLCTPATFHCFSNKQAEQHKSCQVYQNCVLGLATVSGYIVCKMSGTTAALIHTNGILLMDIPVNKYQ